MAVGYKNHLTEICWRNGGEKMKVEELSRYGKPLRMPKEAVKKQDKIVMGILKEEFGRLGLVPFYVTLLNERRKIQREFPDTMKKVDEFGKDTRTEFLMFSSMFRVLIRRMGRENAYEFLKDIMQAIAPISMPAIYQLDELLHCEGDTFENFKKYNIAMFKAIHEEGTWINDLIEDEKDKLTIRVTSCANVDLFGEVGYPELAKLGCDHDLAGYPLIEEDVCCDFRRLCTIAKGDDFCLFEFYRRGTAPDNAHLNR